MELRGKARPSPVPQFGQVEGSGASQRELEALLNRSFPVTAGSSYYDDFPVWDKRHGSNIYRVAARSAGRIVATASLRQASLKTREGESLEIGLIGAVATDEEFRGKGLASRAVQMVIESARWRRIPLLFLWGNEHSMYRRLGFELCGEQTRLPLEKVKAEPVEELHQGFCNGILFALKSRASGLVHGDDDRKWLASHKNVRWFYTGDSLEPSAYAAVGRGIDLTGFVHEWGGTHPSNVHALLARLNQEMPGLQLLGHPNAIKEAGFTPDGTEFLCMARVLDAARVYSAFHPGEPLPPLQTVPDWKLGPALFGPAGEVGTLPHPKLPIPLWLWGLDGV